MLRARTLEITAQDQGGAAVVMQFEIPESSVIGQACDVDQHKK
jgi:hypothetical protein